MDKNSNWGRRFGRGVRGGKSIGKLISFDSRLIRVESECMPGISEIKILRAIENRFKLRIKFFTNIVKYFTRCNFESQLN